MFLNFFWHTDVKNSFYKLKNIILIYFQMKNILNHIG